MSGIKPHQLDVILTAISADRLARDRVHARLLRVAERSQINDGDQGRLRIWPIKLRRQACSCGRRASVEYAHDLATMAILELQAPDAFRVDWQRAEWFGLSERHWNEKMRSAYAVLSGEVQSTWSEAIGHIERRLAAIRRTLAHA